MVCEKLLSKYPQCGIHTLTLWYSSYRCFGGPGLTESVRCL